MSESLDEMRERHAREIDAKMIEVMQSAYCLGMARAPMDPNAVPPIAAIHGTVASKHGLTPREMLQKTQAWRISHPRQEAFSRAKAAGYSLTQIGEYFGGYDHTSVLHGIRAHERRTQLKRGMNKPCQQHNTALA